LPEKFPVKPVMVPRERFCWDFWLEVAIYLYEEKNLGNV